MESDLDLDIHGLLRCGFGSSSFLFGQDMDWIKYIWTIVG
jgi:hypothetical protein